MLALVGESLVISVRADSPGSPRSDPIRVARYLVRFAAAVLLVGLGARLLGPWQPTSLTAGASVATVIQTSLAAPSGRPGAVPASTVGVSAKHFRATLPGSADPYRLDGPAHPLIPFPAVGVVAIEGGPSCALPTGVAGRRGPPGLTTVPA